MKQRPYQTSIQTSASVDTWLTWFDGYQLNRMQHHRRLAQEPAVNIRDPRTSNCRVQGAVVSAVYGFQGEYYTINILYLSSESEKICDYNVTEQLYSIRLDQKCRPVA